MAEARSHENYHTENNMNSDSMNYVTHPVGGDQAEGFLNLKNIVDDPCPFVDEFGTEMVNFGGKIQVVDQADETQLLDNAGETQLLDNVVDDPCPFVDEFGTEMVNFGGKIQVVDQADETQLLDNAGETHLFDNVVDYPCPFVDEFGTEMVNFGGEIDVVDQAGEIQLLENAGETQLLDNVVDDPRPFVDELGTEMVNFGGEIQVVDQAGETQLLDHAGETQLLDHAGETQLLDRADETQLLVPADETKMLDHLGETQLLDDSDCMEEIMQTQLVEECNVGDAACSDDEGTNETQVLCETQELFDDKPHQVSRIFPVYRENKIGPSPCEQDDGDRKTPPDTLRNCENHSGSGHGGFTSLRVACFRASGLAARMKASEGNNGNSGSIKSEHSTLDHPPVLQDVTPLIRNSPKSGQEINDDHVLDECIEDIKESRNDTQLKVGRTTARKLFAEENDDIIDEIREVDAGHNHIDDMSENCLAGLSYANSQEPGELSQANALEVVDRFLMVNIDEDHTKLKTRTASRKKPDVVSSAKGTRRLATSVSRKSVDREHGIYDWDDDHEDDGGGDFFRKKKELFFDDGGPKHTSSAKPRRSRNHTDNNKKRARLVFSDSKLMRHQQRAEDQSLKQKKGKSMKNLTKNLNEQLDMASEDKLAAGTDANKDMLDVGNIGPDTEMAAEAMEALCFELHLANGDDDGSKQGPQNTKSDSSKSKASNRATLPVQNVSQKRTRSSNTGPVTRQTKQTKSSAKLSNAELQQGDQRRDAMMDDFACGKACSNSLAPEIVEQKKETTRKRRSVDVDRSESECCKSQRKCLLQEQLGSSTPVAYRTRKYIDLSTSKSAGNHLVDSKEEINDLMSGGVLKRRRSARPRGKSAKMGSIEALGEVRSVRDKQSDATDYNSVHAADRTSLENGVKDKTLKQSHGKSDAEIRRTVEAGNQSVETSPSKRTPISAPAGTPISKTPRNDASPICMGEEYHKQSCRKNLLRTSLMKEINSLSSSTTIPYSPKKELRKRRDITNVRVLFSHHLDSDVIKQQQKILARLGASVASSMSEASHFVADEFVRTRNMLEAIAFGKPVVTDLWLQCSGQANCLIDERNYILRDARKEKEFGFCMPVSLARACQRPLLQGQRVLITQNTKPGIGILSSLVKAVHGLAIERVGRSMLNDEKLPDNLLVLSCEEDYDICVPFLEKGAAVYSSELLLNGIVTQKLEFERHCLFEDNVKRTRSRTWVKKKNQYQTVTKCK